MLVTTSDNNGHTATVYPHFLVGNLYTHKNDNF